MVYFGSHDAHLYALDAAAGKLLWRLKTGGSVVSSLWPAGEAVYLGSDDGCLYAVEGRR